MNHLCSITLFFVMMIWSCMALAVATVIKVRGDVQMTQAQSASTPLASGQRVEAGAGIKTSANSEITLRFDDGQLLSLSPDTFFIINEYKFNPKKPEESSFSGSLLKGGLRAVAGIIGEKSKNNINFKMGATTVAIHGADFASYYDSELYLAVQEGAVVAKNADGEETFDARFQPYGMVNNEQVKPRPIMKDQFSEIAKATIRVLQAHPLLDTIRKPVPKDPSCVDSL